ncbi:DNA cytosine methyltransferase [Salinibius halmophilus]|uniref:DNA cytosine methyltransferase n=1 Tax=Salinibius halmophilus TaxID=1853216 RepID=UPI0013148364|nr:DNA cytosine methyltransferase [Salinibius halmophilus]
MNFGSLFCGCGGLDLGFQDAGLNPIFAYDNWQAAIDTYNHNFHHSAEKRDLSVEQIIIPKSCDVLVSGSPCQGYSTLGKRRVDDPRNNLLFKAIDAGTESRVPIIVLENVVGAIQGVFRNNWEKAERQLQNNGYWTKTIVLDASNFNVPQQRKRVFLVARLGKKDFQLDPIKQNAKGLGHYIGNNKIDPEDIPKNFQLSSDQLKISKAIAQGKKLCDVRLGDRSVHTWDIPEVFGTTSAEEKLLLVTISKLRRRLRRRSNGDADPVELEQLKQHCGYELDKQILSLVKKGYITKKDGYIDLSHRFNGKYKRPFYDGFSPTVDTTFGNPKNFLHPTQHRGFTVREAAKIQGFPDSFEFFGSIHNQFKMIGNAVPPPLAKALAESILKVL